MLKSLSLPLALAAAPALAEVPSVAVDIAPLHGLVARVMDGVGTPELIVPAGASPHDFALRPSQARALQSADLVVWAGPALAPWLDRTLDTLSSEAVIDVNAYPETRLLKWRESFGDGHDHGHADEMAHADHDHGEDDHAEHDGHANHDDHAEEDAHTGHGHAGHDHGDSAYDPHSWLDPANAKAWSRLIAETLAERDPENAERYRANASEALAEIDAASAAAEALLAPVRDHKFLVFHDAYHYFEEHFDLHAAGAVSLGDAAAPGPARVRALQAQVAAEGITCLFAEPQFDSGLIDTLAEGTGARIATLDPLGSGLETGPGFYPALITGMAKAMADCLKG
ncbi:zinc ABC transporter substrate-binding protein [Marinovum sp.]|uniref:zinc ABC transporter substrate-binding protein n=1 Tax=Marinovum sp. TaxID=2024839 RepID=UPI003A94B7C8